MLPFDRAVEIVGSKAELARRCGVTPQAISQWNPEAVPLDACPAIETATDGRVRCDALRPDTEWQRDQEGRVTGYVVPVVAKVA